MFDRQGAFETQGINLIASNNQANSPFGGWKCLHFFLRWTYEWQRILRWNTKKKKANQDVLTNYIRNSPHSMPTFAMIKLSIDFLTSYPLKP